MDVTVSNEAYGDVTLVTIRGDVDVYTAPVLREHLDRLIATGHRHLVVNLEDVPFIDSTGLGVLVGRLKLTRLQKGSMRVVCTVPRILRVFEITGLNQVFCLFTHTDQALEEAARQAHEPAEAAARDNGPATANANGTGVA